MQTTIPAHSLGNTTFFLHTFIINLHSPFFFILTHLYSYFVIHFYPWKTVDQTVESFKYFYRTTRININRININPNDYYNPVIDYYNPVIDYYNPVIDYYNLLLRFEPCLNLLGLILILCKININLINININTNPT